MKLRFGSGGVPPSGGPVLLTPRFGYALFFAKAPAPDVVLLADIYRGAIPLVLFELALLVVIAVLPGLFIWLPDHVLQLSGHGAVRGKGVMRLA